MHRPQACRVRCGRAGSFHSTGGRRSADPHLSSPNAPAPSQLVPFLCDAAAECGHCRNRLHVISKRRSMTVFCVLKSVLAGKKLTLNSGAETFCGEFFFSAAAAAAVSCCACVV